MFKWKSKMVILAFLLILVAFPCIAIANKAGVVNQIFYLFQDNSNVSQDLKTIQTTVDDDEDNMYNLLKERYANEELYKIVENYALFKCVYQPPKENIDYLCNLVSQGCDLDRLIQVYKFWDDTDEDIGIIKSIYDLYIPELKDNKYWVEDAFNKVTNYRYGELTTEQIRDYVRKGLSHDDIAVANRLSRKGKYTINQILDNKLSGQSWVEIIDDIYSKLKKNKWFKLNQNKLNDYKQITNGDEILQGIFLAQRTGRDVNEYLDMIVAKKSVSNEKAEYVNSRMGEILKKLKDRGLWDEPEETKEENKRYSDYIKGKARENGISDSKFEELKANGNNELDILNASEVAKKYKQDIKEVLKAKSSGKNWKELVEKGVR